MNDKYTNALLKTYEHMKGKNMKPLSVEDARKLFLASDAKYVSQEQTYIYYDNFSGEVEIFPYYSNGCLVVKTRSIWHIHALSEDADLIMAIDDVKKIFDENSEELMVCTWNNIPSELKDKMGAYKLVRCYMSYNDRDIRALTIADAKNIENCCAYDPDDNPIGKDISKEFLTNYKYLLNDPNETILGLFENDSLVGFVQSTFQKDLGLSVINIFVNRTYRRKGYAKRLLSSICATFQDTIYCYSCVKTNTASFNTAKSCGFEFKGAYLLI